MTRDELAALVKAYFEAQENWRNWLQSEVAPNPDALDLLQRLERKLREEVGA